MTVKHDYEHEELIDLGTASEDTLGNLPVGTEEASQFYSTGLSDE